MHTDTHLHTHTRINACTHFPFHPCNPLLSSPSCPIKLKNLGKWNETSKSQALLWLTWYDLYYNLDPLLFFSLPLPSTSRLHIPCSLPPLFRLALQWGGPRGSSECTYVYMYMHKSLCMQINIHIGDKLPVPGQASARALGETVWTLLKHSERGEGRGIWQSNQTPPGDGMGWAHKWMYEKSWRDNQWA